MEFEAGGIIQSNPGGELQAERKYIWEEFSMPKSFQIGSAGTMKSKGIITIAVFSYRFHNPLKYFCLASLKLHNRTECCD